MRSSAVAVAALLLLAGCGGDYSNADIEFAAAVPRRADVTVGLPRSAGLTASGLRERGASGEVVGAPSQRWAETQKAASDLDAMAGFFVDILEAVTRIDPTVRTPELRIWGPFSPSETPSWELQIVITRKPVKIDEAEPGGPSEGFYWQIQLKPKSAPNWLEKPLAEGLFEPGEIRHGRGKVVLYLAEARAAGLPPGDLPATLNGVVLVYDTRTDHPHAIVLAATDTRASGAIGYIALQDGAGFLGFDLFQSQPEATHVQAASRWTAEGAGRADFLVASGTAAGLAVVECWDAQQVVVYVDNPVESDFGGDPLRCPTFPP